jgi:5'-3' exonuclease
MSTDRPILIIDGQNLFIRSWAAYPQMSSHGYQMGGCIGFLKTLRRIVTELQPSQVCVAWEGGGSQRRRSIYPEYKLGRRPEKLNRFYGDDIPDSEENRKHQLVALLGMLKHVPVCQIYASDCEGDDIIAFLCKGPFNRNNKVIVSSDKDMYQLLDEKTNIYSLHKKKVLTNVDIFDEYRIKPHNFAMAKSLCGDDGDNIPGIKGLGFKTAAKKFPFLGGDSEILLEDVVSFCHAHASESSVYKRVVDCQDELVRNWRLIYLDGSMLSASQISKVQNAIDTFSPKVNKIGFVKSLIKEGIGDFDTESFFYAFNCVEGVGIGIGE